MVEYEKVGGDSGWIVNGGLGHKVWERINTSPRVSFGDGIAILAKLVTYGDDTNLTRLGGEDVEGPDDWAEPFSMASPKMRMEFSFSYKLDQENPKEVRMAIYAHTNNGANFTHEFYQEKGEDAEAIIRVPVPDSLRDEALGIADEYNGCEMVREQAGAFNERFNVTDGDVPTDYWEPHIKCEGIKSQGEVLEVFDGVLDIVERGVRAAQ